MLTTLRLAVLAAALPCAASAFSAVVPPPQVAAVYELYKTFAFEAVLDMPIGPYFTDQPKEVLLRYITPELYELIHRDRVCTITKHEICRLDFAPLWGNQDPSGTIASFEPGPSNNTVTGTLRIGAHSSQFTYFLVQTKAGWRVDNIVYDEGRPSLKEILGSK